jgi:nucleoside-diphosphate-sugar epimerase
MRALVTGATGFIGYHVTSLLLSRGIGVRCLVRRTSNTRALERLPGVEFAVGTLSDADSLEEAARDVDLVFHLAGAVVSVDRAGYFRVNRDGTEGLVRAVQRAAPGLARFVLVSSLAAGGPSAPPRIRSEACSDAPITDYGRSKLAAEKRLRRVARVPYTILRPPSVYGPGDVAILPFFQAAARGVGIRFTGGTLYLSLVHVADVAEALYTAAMTPQAAQRTYYVSDGAAPASIEEVQRTIAAAAGRRLALLPVPRALAPPVGAVGDAVARVTGRASFVNRQKVREMLQPGWCCSVARLQEETGFRPSWQFASGGAADTLQWYRKRHWL